MILEFIVKGFKEEAEKIASTIDRRKKLAKRGMKFQGIDRRQKMYKKASTIGSLLKNVGSAKPLQTVGTAMNKVAPKAPKLATSIHPTTPKKV